MRRPGIQPGREIRIGNGGNQLDIAGSSREIYIYSNPFVSSYSLISYLIFVVISREIQRRGNLLGRRRKTKKNVARKHIPIPKSATPRDQLSPTPLVGDVNEECVCGAGASDGFPSLATRSLERPRSLLPRPQRSPSGQSRSVGSKPAPGGEPRVFTAARTFGVAHR